MGNYLVGVITAIAAGAAAELLPPEGERGTDRLLKLITGLLILCVIALPLLDALGAGGDSLLERLDAALAELDTDPAIADRYAAQTMAYIRAASAEAAEGEIVALLAERFGLPTDCCRAEVTLADGEAGIVLAGVKVYLRGRAVLADAAEIEAYLAALFGGQAIVVIE